MAAEEIESLPPADAVDSLAARTDHLDRRVNAEELQLGQFRLEHLRVAAVCAATQPPSQASWTSTAGRVVFQGPREEECIKILAVTGGRRAPTESVKHQRPVRRGVRPSQPPQADSSLAIASSASRSCSVRRWTASGGQALRSSGIQPGPGSAQSRPAVGSQPCVATCRRSSSVIVLRRSRRWSAVATADGCFGTVGAGRNHRERSGRGSLRLRGLQCRPVSVGAEPGRVRSVRLDRGLSSHLRRRPLRWSGRSRPAGGAAHRLSGPP